MLSTARLLLTPLEVSDAAGMLAVLSDPALPGSSEWHISATAVRGSLLARCSTGSLRRA